MDQLASLWRAELGALRDQEALHGNAAVARLADLQTATDKSLDNAWRRARLSRSTQLMEKASEVATRRCRSDWTIAPGNDQQRCQGITNCWKNAVE
jgi:hypothetical protein